MIMDYLQNTGSRDFNAVKAALRSGMGPCGGKTCAELTARIFRELGVDLKAVSCCRWHWSFTQEVPMKAFLVESEGSHRV